MNVVGARVGTDAVLCLDIGGVELINLEEIILVDDDEFEFESELIETVLRCSTFETDAEMESWLLPAPEFVDCCSVFAVAAFVCSSPPLPPPNGLA